MGILSNNQKISWSQIGRRWLYGLLPLLIFVWIGVPAQGMAHEETQNNNPFGEVGFDQRLNEQIPLGSPFRDESGNSVKLGDFFGDKPVILVLSYYNCPMLCPLVLKGLARSLKTLPFNAGEQFKVVVVSINPRDTPQSALAKKRETLRLYGRPKTEDGWHFLTADAGSITPLAEAVGFRYRYDPKLNEYAHAAGIVLLTPRGKIARYFYGIEFPPRDLRLGLVETASNQIGSPVDHLLLLCYRYDPTTGQYGLIIMNLLRLGGIATVLFLGAFVVLMVQRDRKKKVTNRTR